jgi:hypothetical protein
MRGRFTNTWQDALSAEATSRVRTEQERRYRGMLAVTDELLGHLEVLNLSGRTKMDASTRRAVTDALERITPPARARFPICDTVQHALDGVFEVQDELLQQVLRTMGWDVEHEREEHLERRTA